MININITKNRVEDLLCDLQSLNHAMTTISRIAGKNVHLDFISPIFNDLIEDQINSMFRLLSDEESKTDQGIPSHGCVLHAMHTFDRVIEQTLSVRNKIEFIILSGDDADVLDYLVSHIASMVSLIRRINARIRKLNSGY